MWNGYWAFACDFTGNDMSSVQIPAANCAEQCARTVDCTHFSWTHYNGGTCWMKTGLVSKSDAFSVSDSTSLCGVVVSSSTPPNIPARTTRNYGDIFQFLSCLCIVRLYSFLFSFI